MQRTPSLTIVLIQEKEGARDCGGRLFLGSAKDGRRPRCSTRCGFGYGRTGQLRPGTRRATLLQSKLNSPLTKKSRTALGLGRHRFAARKVEAQGSDPQIGLIGDWDEDVAS